MRVVATGMISGLARGAEANAVLMRLEYDAFQRTAFIDPDTREPIIGSIVESVDSQGITRLVDLATLAIDDLVVWQQHDLEPGVIIICLPDRGHRELNQQLTDRFNRRFLVALQNQSASFPTHTAGPQIFYLTGGRTGYSDALVLARRQLSDHSQPNAMIVAVDSLVNGESISQLLGFSNSDYPGRLLLESNPDGMIVGEAAAAVLLEPSSSQNTSGLYVRGVGMGTEPAPLFSNDVSRADGLVAAVKAATDQANIHVEDTDFRIAGVTGESYFFGEDSTLLYRCIKTPKKHHDLWHTTDKIGEVGSATGAAMTTLAFWATQKGYAPGNNILCHISSETARRAAFLLQYRPQSPTTRPDNTTVNG